MPTTKGRENMTAFDVLIRFIGAWLTDAYAQCARDYGRVVGVYEVGANVTRCGRHGCEHEGSQLGGLDGCDRFSTGPWIDLVYLCAGDYDPATYRGCCTRPTEHHARYGATGEARAACWAS